MNYKKDDYSIHFLRAENGEAVFGLFFEDQLIMEDTNESFLKKRLNDLKNEDNRRNNVYQN